MTSGLVAFFCFGAGIVAALLSLILCAFDLLPNWRRLNEVKVLFLSQSFLCVTLFSCQSWLSLISLEHRTQGTTETAVKLLFIWLQAATLYNIAAIILVLYFAKTRNRHFAVSRVCLGTVFGVYLIPLIPLIPFAVYMEKTPCTYKSLNRYSFRQLDCLSSQEITSIETTIIFWRMCLHDALPAVVSLVCAINLFYSRNKYKFKSNFVNFDSSQRKSLTKPLILTVILSAIFLMLFFAVMLAAPPPETTSDVKYDDKSLCSLGFHLTASACVVFSCLSTMPDFGVQSEGSKSDIFIT